jgi:hypothetical protein
LDAVGAVELGEDPADVHLRGARAHVEPLGDLRLRQAGGDIREDVAFGAGEPLDPAFGLLGDVVVVAEGGEHRDGLGE